MIKINTLLVIIGGEIYKNIIITYLKCDNIPMLRKKVYLKIANDGGRKHIQHCRKSHFHDFTKCTRCF